MSWIILVLAGILEVVWAVGLKAHNGRPWVIAVTVVASIASVVLLGIAMKQIPLGTAYAAWTGIGIIGTFILGLILGDPVTAQRMVWAGVIVVGIIGLKLSG